MLAARIHEDGGPEGSKEAPDEHLPGAGDRIRHLLDP